MIFSSANSASASEPLVRCICLFAVLEQTTVEPRLTATPLIRSPRYYGHSFLARPNCHTFTYKKTPLMRSPVNTASATFLKFQLM